MQWRKTETRTGKLEKKAEKSEETKRQAEEKVIKKEERVDDLERTYSSRSQQEDLQIKYIENTHH